MLQSQFDVTGTGPHLLPSHTTPNNINYIYFSCYFGAGSLPTIQVIDLILITTSPEGTQAVFTGICIQMYSVYVLFVWNVWFQPVTI